MSVKLLDFHYAQNASFQYIVALLVSRRNMSSANYISSFQRTSEVSSNQYMMGLTHPLVREPNCDPPESTYTLLVRMQKIKK